MRAVCLCAGGHYAVSVPHLGVCGKPQFRTDMAVRWCLCAGERRGMERGEGPSSQVAGGGCSEGDIGTSFSTHEYLHFFCASERRGLEAGGRGGGARLISEGHGGVWV